MKEENKKQIVQKIDKRISDLEFELIGMEEYGFNFSASQISDEIERVEKLRKRYVS